MSTSTVTFNNAQEIATAIQRNVDLMYAGTIPFYAFDSNQKRLWSVAESKGLSTAVARIINGIK